MKSDCWMDHSPQGDFVKFGRLGRSWRDQMVDATVTANGPSAEKGDPKTVTIVVEGTRHEWPKGDITYSEVVTLEFPDFPQHPERTYSVTYERGQGNKEGVLSPGGSIKVKEGMVFHVHDTGES
jgi:hypothetical protein